MAMKFDKEMILKHRFWIMLGVSVILTLVGIIILELSEPSGAKKLADDLKAVKAFLAKDSQATINHLKLKAELARKSETEVWKDAYDPQAVLFRWPDEVEKQYDFANGYFANEVKITKLADPNPKKWEEAAKNWPADTPFLMHGAFVRQEKDWFEIKDRKGKTKKFFLTKRSEKVVAEDGKPVPFDDMEKHAVKKFLSVGYQRGRYFADPLTTGESDLFKKHYTGQIAPILESVDPYVDPQNGVVQLRGWNYKKGTLPHEGANPDYRFIRYVAVEWPVGGKDINKDAWIAQEDLWIQTEIYRIIKSANDSVSSFTPLGPLPLPAKPAVFAGKPDKRNQAYAFRNSYFDLELTLDEKDTLSLTIRNSLERKQSIDLSFRVLLNNTKGHKEEVVKISGLPLMPKGTKGLDSFTKTFPKEKDERTGVYSVQQMLNWQTAAVKRIDQISIGSNDIGDMSHSQRTFPVALRPFDEKDIAKGDDKKGGIGVGKDKGMPKVGGVRPKGGIPPKGGPDKGKGGAVAAVGNNGLLPLTGLWTDRYVEVTEQSRRLPVAVVLIVDQDHVDRVLTSFNNSKLRFLETQVLLNQYAGSLQPPAAEEEEGKEAAPIKLPVFPGKSGPKGPIGPIAPLRPAESGGADLETNMEMVIYGIVTLYQRYPPRPAAPPDAKQ